MATGTSGTERTIGQLVADATHDLEGIVRGEIALAKAEVTDGAKVIGKGVGLLLGAAFLALMGFVFLLHSAAWGISEWLPVWAGYLIVAVVVIHRRRGARAAGQEGARQRPARTRAGHRPGPADDRRAQDPARRAHGRRGSRVAGRSRCGERDPAPESTASGTHGWHGIRADGARPPRRRLRQPETHAPVDTRCAASTPRRSTGLISSRVSA